MRKPITILSAVVIVAALSAVRAFAQTPPPAGTYIWHGELVAADAKTSVVTLKARLVDAALTDVKKFKAGDRVLLHLSGFDTSADAVRAILPYGADKAKSEKFLVPAEVVSPAVEHSYATFRITAPATAFAEVSGLKAGDWITITSRHRAAADAEAIVAINPYAKRTSQTSSH